MYIVCYVDKDNQRMELIGTYPIETIEDAIEDAKDDLVGNGKEGELFIFKKVGKVELKFIEEIDEKEFK